MIRKGAWLAQLLYRYGKHPMKNVHSLSCWEPVSVGAVGPDPERLVRPPKNITACNGRIKYLIFNFLKTINCCALILIKAITFDLD
jgi:hypothetical protein